MKQVKRETKRLIEESLFALAEKPGAARARAAHVAGRRNAAAIEKRFGRSSDAQKKLLAKQLRPDGFIAFEAIAIERIVPMMLAVDILAAPRIAAVIGLLEGPAVWKRVVHIGDRRQRVRGNILNIVRIRIETMAKIAIRSDLGRRFGGRCGAQVRETRGKRARPYCRPC